MYIPAIILMLLLFNVLTKAPQDGLVYNLALFGTLFGGLPIVFLVVLSTRSSLTRCIAALTEESWTERDAIPLLLGLARESIGIPHTQSWAMLQLATAVKLHSHQLTSEERRQALKIFDFHLSNLATEPYRQDMQPYTVPVLDAVGHIGGKTQIRILRALHVRASRPSTAAELRASVERALTFLEARLASEEAPSVLLRAGHRPDDGLLHAASAPTEVSSSVLLRPSQAER
jgi:hypothetical protein